MVLTRAPPDEPRYTTIYHTLTKMCRRTGLFPISFTLSNNELEITSSQYVGTRIANVYTGQYRDQEVALKVLRIPDAFDVERVTEVRIPKNRQWFMHDQMLYYRHLLPNRIILMLVRKKSSFGTTFVTEILSN